MNNPIIKSLLIFAVLVNVSTVRAGEVGNEVLTPEGRPKSTSIKPCTKRWNNWGQFVQDMDSKIIVFSDFLSMIKEVYYPLYKRIIDQAEDTNYCEVDYDIVPNFPNMPAANRVSLWVKDGDGKSNLILIDKRKFYTNKIKNSERAATIVRELLHPIVGSVEKEPNKAEWILHNLVYELHNVFVQESYSNNQVASQIRELIENYELIGPYDLYYACKDLDFNQCEKYSKMFKKDFPSYYPYQLMTLAEWNSSIEAFNMAVSELISSQNNWYATDAFKRKLNHLGMKDLNQMEWMYNLANQETYLYQKDTCNAVSKRLREIFLENLINGNESDAQKVLEVQKKLDGLRIYIIHDPALNNSGKALKAYELLGINGFQYPDGTYSEYMAPFARLMMRELTSLDEFKNLTSKAPNLVMSAFNELADESTVRESDINKWIYLIDVGLVTKETGRIFYSGQYTLTEYLNRTKSTPEIKRALKKLKRN